MHRAHSSSINRVGVVVVVRARGEKMDVFFLLVSGALDPYHPYGTLQLDPAQQERGLSFSFDLFDKTKDASDVTQIHVVFSNHLDVGFNSRAWCDGGAYKGCISPDQTIDGQLCRPFSNYIIQANIDTFIPRAIQLAKDLRNTSTPFSYMTQPFVAAFLLDCAGSGLNDWRPQNQNKSFLQVSYIYSR